MPQNPRVIHILAPAMISLLFAGCTMWKEKPTAWTNATGAEQFERLFWQDVKDKNWPEVEMHLDGAYVYQSSGALRNRDATLDHMKKLEISDYALGDVEVHPGRGDTVVITYTMDLRGIYDGQPLQLSHVRMMSVWQQEKKGWSTIAHADSLQ